jgi:hypothetical protein
MFALVSSAARDWRAACGFCALSPIGAQLAALLCGLLVSTSAFAQWVYITPPGGVAIKSIQPREDGWVMVTFVDTYPELAGCPNVPMGAVPNPGAKYIYAAVLSASLTGKKLRQITISGVPGGCMLVNVTTAE